MVPFLEVLDGMVKRGVEVRLIHAKDPGPNWRDDFDRYPTLWTAMERMLCPRVHFKCIIVDGRKAYFSRDYNVHIVDRVGAGDSFAAGLLYALGNRFGAQRAVDYAAAASCLKHTIERDVNLSTVAEIERLAQGDGSGRVQR